MSTGRMSKVDEWLTSGSWTLEDFCHFLICFATILTQTKQGREGFLTSLRMSLLEDITYSRTCVLQMQCEPWKIGRENISSSYCFYGCKIVRLVLYSTRYVLSFNLLRVLYFPPLDGVRAGPGVLIPPVSKSILAAVFSIKKISHFVLQWPVGFLPYVLRFLKTDLIHINCPIRTFAQYLSIKKIFAWLNNSGESQQPVLAAPKLYRHFPCWAAALCGLLRAAAAAGEPQENQC